MRSKVIAQTVINRIGNLLLIAVATKQALFAVIGDKTGFDQNRRDIRGAQHA
ncbi:hypothetical protein D3C87_2176750 [compost metagenome]